ncbi:MAG TPA: FAD-dependent oxidoreductase, partial [Firmicutes bacterium]|nr:FAD-dependent oxidoreductase [Bacillota bacterium]
TEFDRPPHPYWLDFAPPGAYPSLEDNISVDVAVVGGGIAGITCALLLKEAGFNVAVLEADRIGRGATGHTTAKITSQHDIIYTKIRQALGKSLARQYAEANETALTKIAELIEEKRLDCDFSWQNAYLFTQRDDYVPKIEAEAALASELGIKASVVENPGLPFPVKAALCYEGQAQFHPLKYLFSLAEAIPGGGSHIFEQARVIKLEQDGKYRLHTAGGRQVTAAKVVLATQYPCYNKAGLYFSRIYVERSYVVAVRTKEPYPGGMYISAEVPGRSLRAAPAGGEELVLVGGEHHKTGQGPDTTTHYRNLVAFARKIFPEPDIRYRWSTQDCTTVDRIPYVGRFLPETPDLYLITGFAKWGMTNSMAAALLIRDLLVKGESPWQDVYDPARKTVTAAAKTFMVENLNVAKEFITGKLASAPSVEDVRPSEGKNVMYHGQKAGAYRDEEGKLYLVDTTCTHLGCELTWNAAERTWDCPCHGSRFSYTGDIVTGPAVEPLASLKEPAQT